MRPSTIFAVVASALLSSTAAAPVAKPAGLGGLGDVLSPVENALGSVMGSGNGAGSGNADGAGAGAGSDNTAVRTRSRCHAHEGQALTQTLGLC